MVSTLLIYIRGQGSAKEAVIMRWKHPPWIHRILFPPLYTQDVGIDVKKKRGIQSFSAFHRVQLLLTHRTIPFCLDPNQLASRRSLLFLPLLYIPLCILYVLIVYTWTFGNSQDNLNLWVFEKERRYMKINISSRKEKFTSHFLSLSIQNNYNRWNKE